MDFWNKARTFAEEAAKKSQEFSIETLRRSQEFTQGASISSIVTETTKKSREFAAEATKKADLLAGQIMTIAADIHMPPIPSIPAIPAIIPGIPGISAIPVATGFPAEEENNVLDTDLEQFGVTEDLREFVRGLTMNTFRGFPLQEEPEITEVPTVSNVRQDLNEWQTRHATLVLSSVKEISKFRYDLCPKYMKERKFWRIYFLLVNTYVSPYERKYMEELRIKAEEKEKEDKLKKEITNLPPSTNTGTNLETRTSLSSNQELDLDTFLLGDFEDDANDEGAEDDGLDDDFDKIDSTSGLESDDEKKSKE